MIINGLKYQTSDNPAGSESVVRLARGKGGLRSTALILGSESELQAVSDAIAFALTGTGSGFAMSVVNIIDDDGGSWVFDRKDNQLRVFRDKQPVDLDVTLPLGLSHLPQSRAELDKSVVGGFLFYAADTGLKACEASARTEKTSKQINWIAELISQKRQAINQILPQVAALPLTKFKKLMANLEAAHREWLEIHKEAQLLTKLNNGGENVTTADINHLEAQIALIDKIELTAAKIIKPGLTIDALSSQYRSVSEKLGALCAEHDIADPAAITQKIDWNNALKLITRLSLYEQLVKASELASQNTLNAIEPVLKAYFEACETFLRNDRQITAELQECLGILTEQLHPSGKASGPAGRLPWQDIWRRVRQLLGKAPNAIAAQNPEPPALPEANGAAPPTHNLDQARMAVDYALGRLGELHANLVSNQDSHLKALGPIQERHEKLVAEYGRLKYSWRELAKRHGFPKKCTVRQLLGLIYNQGLIIQLHKDQLRLQAEIASYREVLETLGTLVAQWRDVTKSVKDSPLDNPQILLAETRGILDYAAKKRNQLSKFKKMQVDHLSQRRLEQLLAARKNASLHRWQEAFRGSAIEIHEISKPFWPQVFGDFHVIESLLGCQEGLEKVFNLAKVLGDETYSQPIKVLRFTPHNGVAPPTQRLLATLREFGVLQGQIILTSDRSLAKSLDKSGLPISRVQARNQGVTVTANASQTQASPSREIIQGAQAKPILSDKAQQALATLTKPAARKPTSKGTL